MDYKGLGICMEKNTYNPKNALVLAPCATSNGELNASDPKETSSLLTTLSNPAATARIIIVLPKTLQQTFPGNGRQPRLPGALQEERVPQPPAFKTSCL